MADVFSITNQQRNNVHRATYDWNHANNLTTEIGRITPIFCELLPANSSLRIKPRAGFQFMPMVFPLQTRMRMRIAFFKYPLRALWNDYRDYIGNFRQGLEEPYLDFANDIPATGSLYDYLGLPTTISGPYSLSKSLKIGRNFSVSGTANGAIKSLVSVGSQFHELDVVITGDGYIYSSPSKIPFGYTKFSYSQQSNIVLVFLDKDMKVVETYSNNVSTPESIPVGAVYFCSGISWPGNSASGVSKVSTGPDSFRWFYDAPSSVPLSTLFFSGTDTQSTIDISNATSPYYDSSSSNRDHQLKISAYAARAYEGIYNSYIRDDRNNPYYIDGEVQYNKWLPNMEGGADPSTNYKIRYANWERDAYTTAVQSPQQGIAPLVGITTYEDTQTLEDGTVKTSQRVALVDEDGNKYGVDFISDNDGLKDVSYTPLSSDTATVKPTSLISLATSGISINDLRNVNAYQKYLELNMRAGYSYKDIIEQRFNVNVRYSDLLMPEFLGGSSTYVEMHSVTQTVMKEDNGMYADALGSQAGQAGVFKETETINAFCDEESIIMGLVWFTPVPIYTQVLPKHFLYRDLLDHFNPEFANIGFQPIKYSELAPVQAWNENHENGSTRLNDTFGYNRPWYEYCQKLDVAHGLFRTQLRNFIMNRVFSGVPDLSQSFLVVDPNQVNDVFSVTETTDKIFGQVWFDISAKLPIPRVALPRLD